MGGNCSQNCFHGNKECKLCGFTHFETEMEVPHGDNIKGNKFFFKVVCGGGGAISIFDIKMKKIRNRKIYLKASGFKSHDRS